MSQLEEFLKLKEEVNKKNIARVKDLYASLINITEILIKEEKYEKAIKYFKETLDLILSLEQNDYLSIYLGDLALNIADCYYQIDDFDNSIKSYNQSIDYYKTYEKNFPGLTSNNKLIEAYKDLAFVYEKEDDLKLAIDNIKNSIAYATKNLNYGHNPKHIYKLAGLYEELVDYYRELVEVDVEDEIVTNSINAINAYKYSIGERLDNYAKIAFIYIDLAGSYLDKMMCDNNISNAKKAEDNYLLAEKYWNLYLLEGNFDLYDNLRTEFHLYRGLTEVYEALNDEDKALDYYIKSFYVSKRLIKKVYKHDYDNVVFEFGFALYRISEIYYNKFEYELVFRFNELAKEFEGFVKDNDDNFWLLQNAYLYQAKSLYNLGEYDKAVDYAFLALGDRKSPRGRAINIGSIYKLLADCYDKLDKKDYVKDYIFMAYDTLSSAKEDSKSAKKDLAYTAIKMYKYLKDEKFLINAIGNAYDVDNTFYQEIISLIINECNIDSKMISEYLKAYRSNKK